MGERTFDQGFVRNCLAFSISETWIMKTDFSTSSMTDLYV